MNPAQLLAHFDRISDAPDAIPRLRRFILDLAVRGKLVEQDPRDEPTSELLKRIQEEKARLVKTGEIKKLETFEPVEVHEIPFTIPSGWEVIRMGWLAQKLGAGSTPLGGKSVYQSEGVPFLRSQNVHDDGLRLDDVALISRSIHERMSGTHIQHGDLLLNITGASIGRCALVPITLIEGNVSQHVAIIRLFLSDIRQFIHLSLTSPFFQEVIDDVQVGVSREGLSMQRLRLFPMLLPPLAEQHRIVAKVDELMALCDRLAAAQALREKQRDRLAASSLNRLNNGADADAFCDYARFTLDNLPRLTTRTEHIQQFRQTILNLAVRGKLVPQDPKDEPASELLIRIQAEKARLLKEGKINSEKPPIPARADELAFKLMPGWQVARISQILVELQTGPFGSSLHQSDYKKGGIPVINPASIKNERLVPVESMAVGPKTLERLATFKLRAGDIVMARRGEMGRCAVVTKDENGWLCGTGSLILRPPEFVLPHFFVTLIGSPFVREYLGSSAVGATMQNLNQSILLNLVIGLPPLAEQQRIVTKVEELMALCDRLEAQLTTTKTESRRLLEAVLHEAISVCSGLKQVSSL